jgi:metallo-beta-lactamase superfamily protein
MAGPLSAMLPTAFGTSPIQAEKSRPDRKAFGSATLATRAVASAGPTPGISSSRLLASAREAVDLVFCTHLHIDHVGWNTVGADGAWTPTFPNARYLVGRRELTDWQARMAAGIAEPMHVRGLRDSVLPLVDAGRVDLVDEGLEFAAGAVLTLLPGHTAGQMGLRLDRLEAHAVRRDQDARATELPDAPMRPSPRPKHRVTSGCLFAFARVDALLGRVVVRPARTWSAPAPAGRQASRL